jgi:hypothetical protein
LTSYTHADSEDVRRKLNAMLEPGCRAHTGVYNNGSTLGVVVASRKGASRLYEFGWAGKTEDAPGYPSPAVSNAGLLEIVSQWRRGEPEELAPATPAVPASGPVAHKVETREEFLRWLSAAKPGATALYHEGSVANYRKDAPLRLTELQRLADDAKPSHPRPAAESVEMQQIQDHIELIQTVTNMAQTDMVRLIQRRTVEGREGEFIYYAIKKGR